MALQNSGAISFADLLQNSDNSNTVNFKRQSGKDYEKIQLLTLMMFHKLLLTTIFQTALAIQQLAAYQIRRR